MKLSKSLRTIIQVILNDSQPIAAKWSRRALLLTQFLYGVLWVESSWWKITVNGKFALNYDGLAYWVSQGSRFPVFEPYKWLIDHVILTHIKLFLPVVFLTELTIGVLFIASKHIRLASLLAFAQSIAITLSVLHAPHEWKWSYFMLMMLSVIYFIKPTASKWSLKRLKKSL